MTQEMFIRISYLIVGAIIGSIAGSYIVSIYYRAKIKYYREVIRAWEKMTGEIMDHVDSQPK